MIKLELDFYGVLKLLLLILGCVSLFYFYDILMYLFIAYILMSSVQPIVQRLDERAVPSWISALGVFVVVFGLLIVVFTLSIPPLISQSQNFLTELPGLLDRIAQRFDLVKYLDGVAVEQYISQMLQGFSKEIATAPAGIIRIGANIFGGLLDIVMIGFFLFYLIIERKSAHALIVAFIPAKDKGRLFEMIDKVEQKLGAWLRGQLLLMFIIGAITYVGLRIVGVPFSLPLAVIAGLLEVVPLIGPIIASVPAILVGLSISPVKALTIAVLYILIQQLENGVIVPKVMKYSVGLDPLFVIIALMVGERLAGPIGALLAVPITAVLIILYREKMSIQHRKAI